MIVKVLPFTGEASKLTFIISNTHFNSVLYKTDLR